MAGEHVGEVVQRRVKTTRLQRSADLRNQGAVARRATNEALTLLPAESWTVIHDVRWPGHKYDNVDHVVVGPPGVFVIDSKNWLFDSDTRWRGREKKRRSRQRAVETAVEASEAVAKLTPGVQPHLVRPVMCFVSDAPVTALAGRVLVCSTVNIVEILESRVHELSSEQRRVASVQLGHRVHDLRAVRTVAKAAHADAKAARTDAKRVTQQGRAAKQAAAEAARASKRRGRRTRNGSLLPVAMVVATAVLFVGFPGVVMDAAGAVSEMVATYAAG